MLRVLCPILLVATLAGFGPARAHEFWLEPQEFRLDPGDRLVAQAKVGETLEGEILGYYPQATVNFDLTQGDNTLPVTGAYEQIPAVDTPVLGEGLHILRFQSANYQLTYETFAEFAKFIREWQLDGALQEHADAGFPETNIREVYFRYAKSLVQVGADAGPGAESGGDRAFGMPLELIARDNPYALPAGETLRLDLLFQGEPLVDGRIKVFHRAPGGGVTVTMMRTDIRGGVSVPSSLGFYLVNAVYLDIASPRMQMLLGASWQSLWASLTYEIE